MFQGTERDCSENSAAPQRPRESELETEREVTALTEEKKKNEQRIAEVRNKTKKEVNVVF